MRTQPLVNRWMPSGLLLAIFLLALPAVAASKAGAETEAEKLAAEAVRVDAEWGLRIPMRDGVNLSARLYKPAVQTGPLPVILNVTPYINDSIHGRGIYFGQRGYVVVAVDSRGRGSSEGEFHPFLQDVQDGYDTVEWIARQPWSDGQVVMMGGSYEGANQWAAAKAFPPHLKSIIPAAPGFFGLDFPGLNNVFRSYDMQWLWLTSGATRNSQMFGDDKFWSDRYRDLYEGKVTFKDFDQFVGNPSTVYQRWMAHPHPDEYWDSITPTQDEYARIDLPILSITGFWDGDQPGTMEFYKRHMQFGSKSAQDKHYLLMGPWDHAGATGAPRISIGGLNVGTESVINLRELHQQWYDWTVKKGPRPELLKDRVTYFVEGRNEWRYAPALDAIKTTEQVLYLDGQGVKSPDAYQSGLLAPTAPDKAHTVYYIDDPLDTEKTVARELGRGADYQNPEWLIYQDDVLGLEEDGLVYHTAPLAEPMEITGFIKADLWLSMDVRDTDFRVSLFEILPDGRSILLTNDIERARYRESPRQEKLVTPGKIERYDFRNFTFVSKLIGTGSRLRLVIDGNDTMAWQQNFNSGGVVAEETAKDARKATVTLYQDKQHRSTLTLPVGE